MNYRVIWKPAAEDELAELWTNASDRDAVARAADRMDELLRRDPESDSESRSGTTRIMVVPPLAIHFKISEPDRHVYVLQVWRSRRPPV